MKIEVLSDADAVARRAAEIVAEHAQTAVAERGRFVMAVSGGSTPWQMLKQLGEMSLPWSQVQLVQMDERVAPIGHEDRNLTHLQQALQAGGTIQAMPVNETDLSAAADRYAETLASLSGTPPVLDLVHLGMGADGHTASLVPGDPVLGVRDHDVALTGEYQGRRRMTLTYPLLNRSRQILWLVTGGAKAEMVARMLEADAGIPAGRIRQTDALLLVDQAAAAKIDGLSGGQQAGED